jgi:hypothetical protein
MERIDASVTIFVMIHDPQALWDRAVTQAIDDKAISDASEASNIEDMIGTRKEPDLSGCLRMIFDPGESPDGCQIEDSSAEID